MSAQTAFHRAVDPMLRLLLPGKADDLLALPADDALRSRIAELAAKSNEGTLSDAEREEYSGYVRANKFMAVLRAEARKFKSGSAA